MSSTLKTLSIRFYCRASKQRIDGKVPIEMAINLDGERLLTHLPRREKPNSFLQQMNARRTNPLREYLNAIESRIREYETSCLREGKAITLGNIKNFIEDGFTERSGTASKTCSNFTVKSSLPVRCPCRRPRGYLLSGYTTHL